MAICTCISSILSLAASALLWVAAMICEDRLEGWEEDAVDQTTKVTREVKVEAFYVMVGDTRCGFPLECVISGEWNLLSSEPACAERMS